jgi:hypothetical protein
VVRNSKQFSKPPYQFIELTRIDSVGGCEPVRTKYLFCIAHIVAISRSLGGEATLDTVNEKNIEIDGSYSDIAALLCGVNDD